MPAKKKAKESTKKEESKESETVLDKDSTSKDTTPRYVTVEKDKEEEKETKPTIEHEMPAKEDKEGASPEEDAPKKPSTGVDKPSSFSLLDADKDESKTPETKVKEPEVSPEPVAEAKEEPASTEDSEKPKPSADSESDWLKDTPTKTEPSSDEGEKKGVGKKIIVLVVVLVVIAGIVAGGVYYYKSNVQIEPEPEVTLNEKPTPMPTEAVKEEVTEEEVDVSKYSLSILNGSGVPGEAGKAEGLLEEAGFAGIETGNADSYDFLETQVSLKSDAPKGVYKEIEKALGSDYKVVQSKDALDDDSSFDVIIIVGSEEPEEAEETPTSTPEEEV